MENTKTESTKTENIEEINVKKTVKAQKYTHGYISDPVRPCVVKIEEIYIPSHDIIFNYEKYKKKLNVFSSVLPRNYIEHSLKYEWSDENLERMKENDSLKRLYDEENDNYVSPTSTKMTDIELSVEFVDKIVEISELRELLDILVDNQNDEAISYLA